MGDAARGSASPLQARATPPLDVDLEHIRRGQTAIRDEFVERHRSHLQAAGGADETYEIDVLLVPAEKRAAFEWCLRP